MGGLGILGTSLARPLSGSVDGVGFVDSTTTILYIVLLSMSSYSGYHDGKTIVLVRVLYLLYVYNKHVLVQVIYFFQLSAFSSLIIDVTRALVEPITCCNRSRDLAYCLASSFITFVRDDIIIR